MKKIKFNPKSFIVSFDKRLLDELLSYRQIRDCDKETGGVLMGELYPHSNRIQITHILVCKHTTNSRYGLELNVACLQKQMNKIWEDSNGTITYLGDWHTHPEFNPKPSYVDYTTFIKNYYTSKFEQNLLIYIILGLNEKIWFKLFNGFRFQKIDK
ncbi:Mov34/MPN/PAD-1 family protein [Aliarcobacter butzleri]|uniref:Mov34/MPN/PAD-1 family protein n=1 Tax=Aliarcobacter butzleri TaxID=28197 RepID=UPI00186809E2|nr:Mov34/MPN/PAD-1 family protein [Aliarcobacter butzleri]MCT7630951.1 Mov34/MPN/PAD-1 family protein [Aliarcobacter butzleri]